MIKSRWLEYALICAVSISISLSFSTIAKEESKKKYALEEPENRQIVEDLLKKHRIVNDLIETDAIDGDKIADGSIDTEHLATNSVTFDKRDELACFLANKNTGQGNFVVDDWVTVAWQTEVYDVGGNFASNTFTAPTTGHYLFICSIMLESCDTAATSYTLQLKTSNREYGTAMNPGVSGGDFSYWTMSCVAIADMDEGDTCYVRIYQTGGAQQTDIDDGNAWFCGKLLK